MLSTVITSTSQMRKLQLREVLICPKSHSRQAPGQASLHTVFTAKTHSVHQEGTLSARQPLGGSSSHCLSWASLAPHGDMGLGWFLAVCFPCLQSFRAQGKPSRFNIVRGHTEFRGQLCF